MTRAGPTEVDRVFETPLQDKCWTCQIIIGNGQTNWNISFCENGEKKQSEKVEKSSRICSISFAFILSRRKIYITYKVFVK